MSKKLILIIVAVLIVLILAVVGFLMMGNKEEKKDPNVVEYQSPLYYKFEKPYVVSFKDGDEIHFLKVGVSIKTYSENVRTLVKTIQPSLDNYAINFLSGITSADLYDGDTIKLEFKEDLRGKLLEDFNFAINESKDRSVENFGTIDEILINELVIQ